jgi:UDP-N-acetylglucosamine 4,6-dehydratase/5-epimerase
MGLSYLSYLQQTMTSTYDRVLVFGGTGSLGQAIVDLWSRKVKRFILFSRDENKHWRVRQRFPHVSILGEMGDVADADAVRKAIEKHQPTLIIVASAMKHIDQCERFPHLCWNTNVKGFLNILDVLRTGDVRSVQKLVFISTDKACAPINIYGMSKSMCERILRNEAMAGFPVDLVAVRYGNVLNSSGSIIPIFQQQAMNESVKELTLTDDRATRFCITLEESVALIEDAVEYAQPGEIMIPIIPSMSIATLAGIFSQRCGKAIKQIGIRAGEKLHELLFSDLERPFIDTVCLHDRARYVLRLKATQPSQDVPPQYSSASPLISAKELVAFVQSWLVSIS